MSKKKLPKEISFLVDGIGEDTPFSYVAPFLSYITKESESKLKEAAQRVYGSTWDISIGILFDCIDGNFSLPIHVDKEKPEEMKALQYFWMLAFSGMVDQLIATLNKLAEPQSPEAKQASRNCMELSFKESVLIFCREYFGLKNFTDARSLSLDEFLLAKKDCYNKAIFERSMMKLQQQKKHIK